MAKKYLNKIYDGYWRVVEQYPSNENGTHYRYILRNEYNGNTSELFDSTLRKIDRGETKLSHIIATRARQAKKGKNIWGW